MFASLISPKRSHHNAANSLFLGAIGDLGSCSCRCRGTGWVQLIPSFDPCNHGIGKLDEVIVHLSKLCLHLFRELKVALLNSGALFRKLNSLEKGDQLFLPVDTFVFFLQVHKGLLALLCQMYGSPVFTPQPM